MLRMTRDRLDDPDPADRLGAERERLRGLSIVWSERPAKSSRSCGHGGVQLVAATVAAAIKSRFFSALPEREVSQPLRGGLVLGVRGDLAARESIRCGSTRSAIWAGWWP